MLAYPNFLETVTQLKPLYFLRALGGGIYIVGVLVMMYNLVATARSGQFVANEPAEAMPLAKEYHEPKGEHWHRWIERRPVQLLIGSFIVILIGGIFELIPTFLIESNVPQIASVAPYTSLELVGRDIYIKEGCNNCHSQMIRPFRSETERYGEYSKAGEFVYDHPFLWGSKRTGPDLARIGGKYPNSWHFHHMLEPESMSPGSIMPVYPWLIEDKMELDDLEAKISAMRTLGVPYPEGYEEIALSDLQTQADEIAANLEESGVQVPSDRDIIALIAYLQRLGTDIQVNENEEKKSYEIKPLSEQ
jgi:cytochrome c oxidase cbb3-type subunit I/II